MIIRIKIKQYYMIFMKLTIKLLINKIPNQKKNLIIKNNKLNKKMRMRKKVVQKKKKLRIIFYLKLFI